MNINYQLSGFPYEGDRSFNAWRDEVYFYLDTLFYFEHSGFLLETFGICDWWLQKLYDRAKPSDISAEIISRAFFIYRLKY